MNLKHSMRSILGLIIALFLFYPSTFSFAAVVTLTWDPNKESDLAGYIIHYSTNPSSYDESVDVGKVTTYNVGSLDGGTTYFFAVTAYDTSGNESGFSNEVSKTTAGIPSGGSGGTPLPSGGSSGLGGSGISENGAAAGGCGFIKSTNPSKAKTVDIAMFLIPFLLCLRTLLKRYRRQWQNTPSLVKVNVTFLHKNIGETEKMEQISMDGGQVDILSRLSTLSNQFKVQASRFTGKKIFSAEPFYLFGCQMQVNRQVALSLILLLCFFITAPKQVEAYTPPSGSALAQKVHPRLLFVPEGYTGFGMKVSAMRTKLKTYHKTAFQTYIDTLDSHYSDSITAKDDILLKYDGMGYAFLALLDPSTMGPEFTFAHTKAEYAALAKSHALQIVSTLLSLGTGDGDVRHFSDGGGSASLAAAAIYDWTQSFWTMAEKQTLAQAFITMVSIPKGNLTKTLHTDAFEDSMQYYGSIAMFGDTIDGVDSTGTPFSTKLQAMLDEMASYWVEGTGYFPQLDFFYNGESGWHESVWGYGSTTFMTLSLLASGLSTAINKNYFYDSSYFRYYGKWLSAMTRPTYYPLTEPTGGYRTAKFNAMSQGGANEPVWAISASGLAGMLYGYDNTMSQAANWHVSKYGTGYTATDSEQREKWLMWKFYWGTGHLPAPPSTSPLALSLKQGIQAYSFRTGYGNVSDTFITFHAPNKMPKTGGHASALDHSSFTVEKYGNLIFHGGVPKSYSRGVPSYSGSANLDFSLLGIYKPGEVDDAGFNRMSQTWPSSTSSDPNPICKLSDTRCYIGTVTHEEINNGSYDYVAYDYSNMLPKSKATHTDREFLYLRGNADHEFIVVMDRAITADPSYQKRWHVKISFDPVAVGGLWTPISVDSTCPLVTGSSVISLTTDPRCTDGTWIPGGKWSTTADTVQITNNYPAGTSHGRMFLKSVYPASTLYKIGGDRHEFDDAEGKSFYFKTALDQTIANLNGDALERQYLIDHGADFAGRYRLEIRPNVARTADQFLTVMQIGDSKTLTKMDPVDQIATTTSNMIGANIKDPKLNKVVLFSSNTTGGNVSGSVTYTIKPTANSRHHLFNMPPSTSFKVDVTTSTTSQIVTVSPGTGYISSSQGVLVFGVSAAGVTIDLTPPAPPKNLR